MRLRTWALSESNEGARSTVNCQYIDGLLRRGCLATRPGLTISSDHTEENGVPCVRLRFHVPQESGSNASTSIPVLVPSAFVGTDIMTTAFIFYALVEEIILRLANIGPKHTLIRLSRHNDSRRLPHSYSPSWQHLHNGFTMFISSLRHDEARFPGLGRFSGPLGDIEVAQARTPSDEISSDYVVVITLSNKQRMGLFLPRNVAHLPRDLWLDWLELQNQFSTALL